MPTCEASLWQYTTVGWLPIPTCRSSGPNAQRIAPLSRCCSSALRIHQRMRIRWPSEVSAVDAEKQPGLAPGATVAGGRGPTREVDPADPGAAAGTTIAKQEGRAAGAPISADASRANPVLVAMAPKSAGPAGTTDSAVARTTRQCRRRRRYRRYRRPVHSRTRLPGRANRTRRRRRPRRPRRRP